MRDAEKEYVGLVTITQDRYDALVDIETRASVLRIKCVEILEEIIEAHERNGEVKEFSRIKYITMNVKELMDLFAFNATFRGFQTKEEELIKKFEKARSEQDA